MGLLEAHFSPTPPVNVLRFKFHKMNLNLLYCNYILQYTAYVAKPSHVSQHGCFEDDLDGMLRNHIVLGVRDEALRQRLLFEPHLTLAMA